MKCSCTKCKNCENERTRGYTVCRECRNGCQNDSRYSGAVRKEHIGKPL